MKKLAYILTSAALLLGTVAAQAGDGWLTDFDKALATAKEQDKHILLEFQGSDWCPPCIQLSEKVLSTDAFKEYAASELVLVMADFPRRKELSDEQKAHNQKLAEKYGIQYFPTVLVLDQDGQVLDKMVGFPKGGLEGFLSFLKESTASGS